MGRERKVEAVVVLAMLMVAALPEMVSADHLWIFPCWSEFIKSWKWPPEGSWNRFFWHAALGKVGLCAKDCVEAKHPHASWWDCWLGEAWDECRATCDYNILGPGRPPDTPCPNPFYHGPPHKPST